MGYSVDAIASQLREAMTQALKEPAMKARIEGSGMEGFPIRGDALLKAQRDDMDRWSQVIKKAGIQPE